MARIPTIKIKHSTTYGQFYHMLCRCFDDSIYIRKIKWPADDEIIDKTILWDHQVTSVKPDMEVGLFENHIGGIFGTKIKLQDSAKWKDIDGKKTLGECCKVKSHILELIDEL